MSPRATYRLQFSRAFTLADAVGVVPYLARLGISHLYASPLLAARPGSTHGYDIVDHTAINPELGGMAALRELVAALRRHDMGLLLDIVPNHMGVGGADNRTWLDVLEWGRASPYADWFDIDWEPGDQRLTGKVLAPFLGAAYGTELAAGAIRLRIDETEGSLSAWYHEHRLPIAPRDYAAVLAAEPDPPAALGPVHEAARALVGGLRARYGPQRIRPLAAAMKAALAAALADPAAAALAAGPLARFDPGSAPGRAALHRLLERQHFRLCWWRAAADEINYRRFFDINSLAGFRVEVAEAFEASHDLLLRLWAEGLVDGFRVDHVDGLADPRSYCRKLRRRMNGLAEGRPVGLSRRPWILVEKIRAHHEHLPTDWGVDGTTGYDFMDAVGALLHDPAGEPALTAAFAALPGAEADPRAAEVAARRQILRDHLSSEVTGVALVVHRLLQRDLVTRDFTQTAIRRALAEVAAHFPVYRTYVTGRGPRPADAQVLDWAFAGATRAMRATERPLLAELRRVVSGEALRAAPRGALRRDALASVRRFQQLTSPTAAKAVEDTTFYRHVRLLSRNEVGASPTQFALAPATFHRAARAAHAHPFQLLATATHDHKRGEDARTRLAVLSERTEEWTATAERWRRLNAPLRTMLPGGPAPDAVDEYMLYQALVGAWPPQLAAADRTGVEALVDRIARWLEKALREAKRHSEWALPDVAYEEAAQRFLRQAFHPERVADFAAEIAAFVARIAAEGAAKSLVQLGLKCLGPGLPDFYQGCEGWDYSLVDPDNRRTVDFATLSATAPAAGGPAPDPARWHDGAIKRWLSARLLALRAERAELFAAGRYRPVRLRGPLAPRLVASARDWRGRVVLLVGLRLPAGLLEPCGLGLSPATVAAAARTLPVLPEAWRAFRWRDLLGSAGAEPPQASLAVGALLARLPLALLEGQQS